MNPILSTILLLAASNVFMTFAWYGHLKTLGQQAAHCGGPGSAGAVFIRILIGANHHRLERLGTHVPQLNNVDQDMRR